MSVLMNGVCVCDTIMCLCVITVYETEAAGIYGYVW